MSGSMTIFWLVCIGILASVAAEEVLSMNCTRSPSEAKPFSEVHSVSISPCALAPDGPCEIVRGENITIKAEMTLKNKVSKKAKHYYFWESTVDIPFKGINVNACTFMKCPAKKNTRQTYEGIITTRRTFPPGTYPVKIRINQGRKIIFCQVVRIKLV